MRWFQPASLFVGFSLWIAAGDLTWAQGVQEPGQSSLPTDNRGESPEEQKERVAVERFLQVLQQSPKEGIALDRVVAWYIEQGRLEELCTALKRQQAEGDGHAAMLLGLLLKRRALEPEARQSFEAAERLLPADPQASYQLGRILLATGQLDAASAALQRAIDKHPSRSDTLEILKELGRSFQRAQRSSDALRVWKQMESLFPGDLQVQEQIARTLLEEGDEAAALERYTALENLSRDPFRQVELGVQAAALEMKLGRSEEALTHFERLLTRVNPESWLHQQIRQRIDQHFLSQRDMPGLVAYYQRWIDHHPQDLDAMLRIGRLLSIQNQTTDAKPWFQRVIESAPNRAEGYLELSLALERDGQYAQAAAVMQQLCQRMPSNPDYLVRCGELILVDAQRPIEERRRAAAEVWRGLLQNHASDPVMHARVADLMKAARQTDDALAYYRRAIELDPDQLQYREYLGEYLHQLERPAEALATWQEMASGPRATTDNLFRLSEVLAHHGYLQPALAAMEQACHLRPSLAQRLRYIDKLSEWKRHDMALAQLPLARAQAGTEEEQQLVLEHEVTCYRLAGTLSSELAQADAQLKSSASSAGDVAQWQRYAMLLNASDQTAEATRAIDKALRLKPDSIGLLSLAAKLQTQAGRLDNAITLLRRRLTLDRRNQLSLLGEIADLQLRARDDLAAFRTAQELLNTGNAGSQHLRLFSDLCVRLDKPEEDLQALRRYLRMHPDDREIQSLLAQRLSELYKTSEAIELWWSTLASAANFSERKLVVERLTDLYRRTSQLPKLIERLDQFGRQHNVPFEVSLLKAQVWQQTGDYSRARSILEPLAADRKEPELFRQLIGLSQSANDWKNAARFQEELNQIEPTDDGRFTLARYLIASQDAAVSSRAWSTLPAGSLTLDQLIQSIDLLQSYNQGEQLEKLGRRIALDAPQDWHQLILCAIALAQTGQASLADELARQVLQLQLPLDTRAIASSATTPNQSGNSGSSSSAPMAASISNLGGRFLVGRQLMSIGWTDFVLASPPNPLTSHLSALARAARPISQINLRSRNSPQISGLSLVSSGSLQIDNYRDARLLALGLRQVLTAHSAANKPPFDLAFVSVETDVNKLWEHFFITLVDDLSRSDTQYFSAPGVLPLAVPLGLSRSGSTVAAAEAGALSGAAEIRSAVLRRLIELDQVEAHLVRLFDDLMLNSFRSDANLIDPNRTVDTAHYLRLVNSFAAIEPLVVRSTANVLINYGQVLENNLSRINQSEAAARVRELTLGIARKYPSYDHAQAIARYAPETAVELLVEMCRVSLEQFPVVNQPLSNSTLSVTSQQGMQLTAQISSQGTINALIAGQSNSVTQFSFVLPQLLSAPDAQRHLVTLLKELKRIQAEHVRDLDAEHLGSYVLDAHFQSRHQVGNQVRAIVVDFPSPSAFMSAELLVLLSFCQLNGDAKLRRAIEEQLEQDARPATFDPAIADPATPDARQRAVDQLCLIVWKWWMGSKLEEETVLAVDRLRRSLPEADVLVFMQAQMLTELRRYDQAIELLEAHQTASPRLVTPPEVDYTQETRDRLLLDLLLNKNNLSGARAVLERLLENQPPSVQLAYADKMQRVGMNVNASPVPQPVNRRTSRTGAGRVAQMQRLVVSQDHVGAREIARQILHDTRSLGLVTGTGAPGTTAVSASQLQLLQSGSADQLDNVAARQQALLVLRGDPSLTQQIADLEARLTESPGSRPLSFELAECYEAVGNVSKAAELLRPFQPTPRSAIVSLGSLPARITLSGLASGSAPRIASDNVRSQMALLQTAPATFDQDVATVLAAISATNQWPILNELANWDFSKFPNQGVGLERLLAEAAKRSNAGTASAIVSKLLEADRIELIAIFVHTLNLHREQLEPQLAEKCLQRILALIPQRPLAELFPQSVGAGGRVQGPIGVLAGLVTTDEQAQRVLEVVAAHLNEQPALRALQAAMLIEQHKTDAALELIDSLCLPDQNDPRSTWELASELLQTYQLAPLAIRLIEPIAKSQSAPLRPDANELKNLLFRCYSVTHDQAKQAIMLHEAIEAQLGPKRADALLQGYHPTYQRSTVANFAAYCEAANLPWDALMLTAAYREQAAIINVRGLPSQTTDQTVAKQQAQYLSVLTLAGLIDGLKQSADRRYYDHPLSLAYALFQPSFAGTLVSQPNNCDFLDLLGRIFNKPQELQVVHDLLVDVRARADELPEATLIALILLSDQIASYEDVVLFARALLARPVMQAMSQQKATAWPASTESQLRQSLWIVAQRLAARSQTELTERVAKLAQQSALSNPMQDIEAQVRLASVLFDHNQSDAAVRQLGGALERLKLANQVNTDQQLWLWLEAARMASHHQQHVFSLDAVESALATTSLVQLLDHEMLASGLRANRRGLQANSLGIREPQRKVTQTFMWILELWAEQNVEPAQVTQLLRQQILPEGDSEVRLLAGVHSSTLADPNQSIAHQIGRPIAGANNSAQLAKVFQGLVKPEPVHCLALELVDWAQRAGQLDSLIEQLRKRVEQSEQSDGQAVLLYALRRHGDRPAFDALLQSITSSESILTMRLDLLLRAAVTPLALAGKSINNVQSSVAERAISLASLESLLKKSLKRDLLVAAPYCHQLIIQAIEQDDLQGCMRLIQLFEVARREYQTQQSAASPNQEYLFLNDLTAKCMEAGKPYLALSCLARLQQLSLSDKRSARMVTLGTARDAFLNLLTLPAERRYEIARWMLLESPTLSALDFHIYFLPGSEVPPYLVQSQRQAQFDALRPYPQADVVSLLDLLLNEAELRGEIDEVITRLADRALEITPHQPASRLLRDASSLNSITDQFLASSLADWLRMRAEARELAVPAAAQRLLELEMPASAEVARILWRPVGMQWQLFQYQSQRKRLPPAVVQYFAKQPHDPDRFAEPMKHAVDTLLCQQPDFQPTSGLKHWLEANALAPSRVVTRPIGPQSWFISPRRELRGVHDGSALLLDIPLSGDVSLKYDLELSPLTQPLNARLVALHSGLGVEYRHRTNRALIGAPVKLSAWLSGDRVDDELSLSLAVRPNETSHRFSVQMQRTGQELHFSIDGLPIAKSSLTSESFPFVGLLPLGAYATFSEVEVRGGQPLKQVQLLDRSLSGWNALRYNMRLPRARQLMTSHEAPQPIELNFDGSESNWYFEDDQLRTRGLARALRGKSVLNNSHHYLGYARPLRSGDRLEYEIYSDGQQMAAAPAVGFQAMLINQEQIELHWLSTEPDHELLGIELHNRGQDPTAERLASARLLPDQWNKVEVRLEDSASGLTMTLALNGTDIYRRSLARDSSTEFGWYCAADDDHQVQIRRATLRGHWPDAIPDDLWQR